MGLIACLYSTTPNTRGRRGFRGRRGAGFVQQRTPRGRQGAAFVQLKTEEFQTGNAGVTAVETGSGSRGRRRGRGRGGRGRRAQRQTRSDDTYDTEEAATPGKLQIAIFQEPQVGVRTTFSTDLLCIVIG